MRRKGLSGPPQPAVIAPKAVGRSRHVQVPSTLGGDETDATPPLVGSPCRRLRFINRKKRREACATSEVLSATLFLLS